MGAPFFASASYLNLGQGAGFEKTSGPFLTWPGSNSMHDMVSLDLNNDNGLDIVYAHSKPTISQYDRDKDLMGWQDTMGRLYWRQ